MAFNSTVNNHNKVKWRNNLNDLSDLEDDLDNELPLSSISDFGYLFNNHEINKMKVQKCKIIDCQEKQDYKSSYLFITDFKRPTDNSETKKYRPQKYETVDYQIELDIKQGNELPLSSIADFLCPINHEVGNGGLKKCRTVDNQTEVNNQNNELPLSSIEGLKKCEAVDFQSKGNINNNNKSESDRVICNKEQNTTNNLTERFECDICGKIFPTRILIIHHFQVSLCYPENLYYIL
uniref:C2H2-type domain-containing protein n=1 Tax=Schizaphis graminum TaxID=13262 RepID=A0A2S2P6I2_SCHGA